jgi:hypothetical protein
VSVFYLVKQALRRMIFSINHAVKLVFMSVENPLNFLSSHNETFNKTQAAWGANLLPPLSSHSLYNRDPLHSGRVLPLPCERTKGWRLPVLPSKEAYDGVVTIITHAAARTDSNEEIAIHLGHGLRLMMRWRLR